MGKDSYVLGVDYGTDSVRTVLVNTANGDTIASSVFYYPRWKEGLYCNAAENQFRQHPLDYIEGLEQTIKACVKEAGATIAANICAIGVDTTGSSPVAVDYTGTPLALRAQFAENPNAMFVLWKDHTSLPEAAQINEHAKKFEVNYLQYVGGIYSSEWFWAKLLHVLREDEAVREACHSWVEHCDWIPFLLTGGKDITELKRSVCAAGHKGLWAEAFNGYPPDSFFSSLDPLLKDYVTTLGKHTYTSDQAAGILSKEWAAKLGLPDTVTVAVGAFDAHMGAVGGQIEPYYLSRVMGTSTCDILVAPTDELGDTLVKGICGQVNGSVIPGMIGLEAGQSAFGDTYAWFKNLVLQPVKEIIEASTIIDQSVKNKIIEELAEKLLPELSAKAALLYPDEKDEIALDWLNGRRTPDANQFLKSSINGLSLSTDAVKIFRSLVEATCFGARMIIDRFEQQGVPVKGVIGLGGVAKRAPYVMQVLSNVLNRPIRIHKSDQTCAIGAAMFAATAAGVYTKVEEAMVQMGQGFDNVYEADPAKAAIYDQRYEQYKKQGAFVEQHSNKL